MTIRELLEYMDGSGLIITDWEEIEDNVLGWFDASLESEVLLDGEEL